jgi:hypothetical protein
MNTLVAVFCELTGLFIDDGSLALAILAVVALAGAFAFLMPGVSMATGVILLFGCLGVLFVAMLGSLQSPQQRARPLHIGSI